MMFAAPIPEHVVRLEALLAERRERVVDATNRLRLAEAEPIAAAENQAIAHGYRVEKPEHTRRPCDPATFVALVDRLVHTREGSAVLGLRHVRRQKMRDRVRRGLLKGPPRRIFAANLLRNDVHLVRPQWGDGRVPHLLARKAAPEAWRGRAAPRHESGVKPLVSMSLARALQKPLPRRRGWHDGFGTRIDPPGHAARCPQAPCAARSWQHPSS